MPHTAAAVSYSGQDKDNPATHYRHARAWIAHRVHCPYPSLPCTHQGLLQRRAEDRMTFQSFFEHPFVDVEHAPAPTSLQRCGGASWRRHRREGDHPTPLQPHSSPFHLPLTEHGSTGIRRPISRRRANSLQRCRRMLRRLLTFTPLPTSLTA